MIQDIHGLKFREGGIDSPMLRTIRRSTKRMCLSNGLGTSRRLEHEVIKLCSATKIIFEGKS
jgi:hypothetical protein